MAEIEDHAKNLLSYGLDPVTVKNVSESAKTYKSLLEIYTAVNLKKDPSSSNAAKLMFTAMTKLKPQVANDIRHMVYVAICDGRIMNTTRLELAVNWVHTRMKPKGEVVEAAAMSVPTTEEFNKVIGVGVVVHEDEIVKLVQDCMISNKEEISEKRYRYPAGLIVKQVAERNKFADSAIVLAEATKQMEAILGPKTEADNAPLDKSAIKKKKETKDKKDEAKEKAAAEKAASEAAASGTVGEEPVDAFQGIPSQFDARHLDIMVNSPELLAAHKAATGGIVMTRFPPEPNGYLHIGHAKAMYLDFGYAKKMGGKCVLRFDDTNPEAEKQEYIDGIINIVKWLGHEPCAITYSSDYFDTLFALCKKLIKKDLAYVCHQTSEEISAGRETMTDSPWRNRPVEESLKLFDDMAAGKFPENGATVRMKIDMKHPNTVMRDPIAYRIKYHAHPRTGDKWCVYPSYDYTHCLVDSLEWITHSLCTLEFEIRRDQYYWLIAALDMYRPFVWEFSRLNVEKTMVSKRKLLALVKSKTVRGWDDPRMPTLLAMRRKGYPPTAINEFCSQIGVSRNANTIGLHKLEYCIRTELDESVPRAFCVLKPLKVEITNFPADKASSGIELVVPNHPKKPELGEHKIMFTKVVYVERSDFRAVDEKGYYGLAPGKTALLRYAYPITVDKVENDPTTGEAATLYCTYDPERSSKPKGVLHWVADDAKEVNSGSVACEIRQYEPLFKSDDPSSLGGDSWMDDINPNSEVIHKDCKLDAFAAKAKPGDRFQFERLGYYTCDSDSTDAWKVFNLTVSLRDSYPKEK